MENWNPFGWLLLVGGFLFGVIVGGPQAGDKLWLISYTADKYDPHSLAIRPQSEIDPRSIADLTS